MPTACAQAGYPSGHVHSFLSDDPDSWSEALKTGFARVRAASTRWVIADPPGEPAELLVVEIPESGIGKLLQRLVRSADGRSYPDWVKHVLPLAESAPSPALLVAESGCRPEVIVQALLERRLGASARVEYFAPARLSLPVQLRELFGTAPRLASGARRPRSPW